MQPFTLRTFRQDDLDALVKHANDPTVAAHLTDAFPHPYNEAHGRAFIEQALQSPPLRRCIDLNGECVGAIGLHPKTDLWRQNMELGYWLAKGHRGKGIMTEAIRQMVELGFAEFQEITRIYATPFGSNIASQKALEKAGFVLEAKLIGTLVKNGKVEDEWIYAVRRSSIQEHPSRTLWSGNMDQFAPCPEGPVTPACGTTAPPSCKAIDAVTPTATLSGTMGLT